MTIRGRHRVKSAALPVRETFDEAQHDLNAYAALHKLREVVDADCAACINNGFDFSPMCNGKPCPYWDAHHA
jgi:hypothetical protein